MKHKKRGSLEVFTASLIFLTLVIITLLNIKLREIKIAKNFTEDGLVASNLAAATVDLKEYGTSNKIVNNDFNKSFNDYTTALKDNLKLDENYCSKIPLISGKINIDKFKIYNVIGNNIEEISRDIDGSISEQTITNGVGTYKTPNGVLINSTTVYSKITFNIKGLDNKIYSVYKENSVDITDK